MRSQELQFKEKESELKRKLNNLTKEHKDNFEKLNVKYLMETRELTKENKSLTHQIQVQR